METNQTTVTSIAGHSLPGKAGKITINSRKAMNTDCSSDARSYCKNPPCYILELL